MDKIKPQLSGTPPLLLIIPRSVGPGTSFPSAPLLQARRGRPPPAYGSPGPEAASGVVEPEGLSQPSGGLKAVGVGLQVDLFVLHRPALPLDKYVVLVPASAIQADLHRVILEYLRELAAGELTSLVGVEYIWPSLAEGLGQGCRHGSGRLCGQALLAHRARGENPGCPAPAGRTGLRCAL